MTGKAGRARHSRHAVVCTVCALLLSTSGTVFGLHRYNAQLRNDCAAAVSAAGQAVNDYMSAVSGTDTALKNARDTDGYRTSDGAAELISQVSDVNRQVRVDLTCTDREQLRTLRSTTSDLNTAKDALNTNSLHLTVSISAFKNTNEANRLGSEIEVAQNVYNDSAAQLPGDGVRGELKKRIDEAVALRDAASSAREQATEQNDPAPADESTEAMGAKRIELSSKKEATAKAAGIAAQQAAEDEKKKDDSKNNSSSDDTDDKNSGGSTDSVSGGSSSNPSSAPSTGNGGGGPQSSPKDDDEYGDDDDDDDDDDDEYWHRHRHSSCGWVWVNRPYYDDWGWHPGYWAWRRC